MSKASKEPILRRSSFILKSKITPPVEQQGMELRSRLLPDPAEIPELALMLIQAPAGYGKTTLLKQLTRHFQHAGLQAAWLTLCHTENDPIRAIEHISAAFGILDPAIDQEMAVYFSATPPYPVEDIISALIHSLERFESGATLILDDYHEISSPDVHNAVFFLLSNLPKSICSIVASRTRPPFAFNRLEEKGKVVTLDRNALRFTAEETAQYLKNAGNLELASENLTEFSAHTEGWITAIKLAVMSLDVGGSEHQVQKLITGSHYALVDYLTEAVLNKHGAETRRFLLQTAPLGRLTVDLCNAVTQQDNASEQIGKLARENLFLNPLDAEGKWYRYHSLFSEFLGGLLSQEASLDRAEIHKRASRWYLDNGMLEEAVDHGIASGDIQYVTTVINASVVEVIRAGQVSRLLGWLTLLPEKIISRSPQLLTHLIWCQLLTHQIQAAKKSTKIAERLYREQFDLLEEEDRRRIPEYLAELGVIDQFTKRISNDQWDDPKPLLALKDSLDPDWVFIRAVTEVELGYIYLHQDKLDNAYAAFQDGHAYGRAVPNAFVVSMATQVMAFVRRLQGRLTDGQNLCRQGMKDAIDESQQPLPAAGRFDLTLAQLSYEANDLDTCRDSLRKSIELYPLSSDPVLLAETEILSAKLVGLERGPKDVVDRLYEAERKVSSRGTPRLLNQIRAYQAWYLIEGEDLSSAEAILRQCEMPLDKPRPAPGFHASPEAEIFYLAMCRYWIAVGSYKQAGAWLRHLLRNAESSSRLPSVVMISGLLAVMLANQEQPEAAIRLIRDIMVMATEVGLARSVLDLGNEFVRLLEGYYRLRTSKDREELQDPVISHIHHLLAISEGEMSAISTSQAPVTGGSPASAGQQETDSLTPREIQVLEQVAKGLKNREVAEELLIAESSVRWHIKNIYTKLDVHNRTEASIKAREMKILR
ncbi:hypothetical protein HBA55_02745 [Pseudomaricurvus alkylphenolicus]|uniref:LuxR C-terminal-related transcriptional regulator n=1 Tax=Pseudomaricurvus alkylphenolicus TaxID=1306991 RepID=UPI00142036F5|nr:LuxR C-terminal-related transcriptional regulator [Pseudomaricurvus alkylphenolicus]NIB38483.1 hypothetical protein [Pseudomaricurvus alkylphenolicus]